MQDESITSKQTEAEELSERIGRRVWSAFARAYRLGFLDMAVDTTEEEKESIRIRCRAELALGRDLEPGESAAEAVDKFEGTAQAEAPGNTEKYNAVLDAVSRYTETYIEKGLQYGRRDAWFCLDSGKISPLTKENAEAAMVYGLSEIIAEFSSGSPLKIGDEVIYKGNFAGLLKAPERVTVRHFETGTHCATCQMCSLHDWYKSIAMDMLGKISSDR